MNRLIKQRFGELMDQAEKVEASKRKKSSGLYGDSLADYVDNDLLLAWTVKAQDTLSKVCGTESQHFLHFSEAEKGGSFRTNLDNFRRMKAVFVAAKEDFEGGYLVATHDLIRAEVFNSELEQASELLKSNYRAAAAIIAGTVLETALRGLCERNHIAPGKLDKMNADLAKAGVYNGIVQKRVTHLAAVRNSAAHGNESEFNTHDVAAMIGEIEQFLANHCS